MAGEVVYADLRHPEDGFSPAQKCRAPASCPWWHRVLLKASVLGHLVLLLLVLVLGVRVFQGFLQQEARNVSQSNESNSTERCLVSAMIQYFCEPQQDRLPALAGCKVCPRTWELHGDTCYQLSKEKGTWTQGKNDCETQRSQLVVLRDKKEKEYMRNMTRQRPVWIGLTSCHEKCRWVDDTPYDIKMFGALEKDKGMCVTLKDQELDVDVCDNDQHWVCQKESLELFQPEAGDGEKCNNHP